MKNRLLYIILFLPFCLQAQGIWLNTEHNAFVHSSATPTASYGASYRPQTYSTISSGSKYSSFVSGGTLNSIGATQPVQPIANSSELVSDPTAKISIRRSGSNPFDGDKPDWTDAGGTDIYQPLADGTLFLLLLTFIMFIVTFIKRYKIRF